MANKHIIDFKGNFDTKGMLSTIDLLGKKLQNLKIGNKAKGKLSLELQNATKDAQALRAILSQGMSSLADVSRAEKAFKKYENSIGKIQKQMNKISKTDFIEYSPNAKTIKKLNTDLTKLGDKKKAIFEQQKKGLLRKGVGDTAGIGVNANTVKAWKDAKAIVGGLQGQINQFKQELSGYDQATLASMTKTEAAIKNIQNEIKETGQITEKNIADLQKQGVKVDKRFKDPEKVDTKIDDRKRDIVEYRAEYTKLTQRYAVATKALKDFNLAQDSTADSMNEVEKEIMDVTNRIQQLEQESVDLGMDNTKEITGDLQKLSNGVKGYGHAANETSEEIKRVNEQQAKFANATNTIKRIFGFSQAYLLLSRTIRTAYNNIKDLDKSITQIAIVTDMTAADLWDNIGAYNKLATRLGSTVEGAYATSKLYYQQGKETNEVMQLTTETIKMARIAGLDYATSTNYMTAALNGFKLELEQANMVNDIFSNLSANAAVSTEELSYSLTKTASIAKSAGMEIATTSAFLAGMIEVTREAPENIGTAMKTIIARFQQLTKSADELEPVDGEMVDVNSVDKALKSVGVSLRNTSGQFKDLDDVFLELSKKWSTLDNITQRYIATSAAGTRQQSRFLALMNDYERTMELVGLAENSAGASAIQFHKTLDSLESKINQLSNAFQELYLKIANAETFKFIIDSLSAILGFLNQMPLPISALLLVFGSSMIKNFVVGIIRGVQSGMSAIAPVAAKAQDKSDAIAKSKFRRLIGWFKRYAKRNPVEIQTEFEKNQLKSKKNAKGLSGAAGNAAGKFIGKFTSLLSKASIWIGVATALIGAISFVIKIAEHRAEKAAKRLQESQAKLEISKKELGEINSLEMAYNNLIKAQDGSNEKKEELVTLIDEITTKYPTLIQYLDEDARLAGHAADAWERLNEAKEQETLKQASVTNIDRIDSLGKEAKSTRQDYNIGSNKIEIKFGTFGDYEQKIVDNLELIEAAGRSDNRTEDIQKVLGSTADIRENPYDDTKQQLIQKNSEGAIIRITNLTDAGLKSYRELSELYSDRQKELGIEKQQMDNALMTSMGDAVSLAFSNNKDVEEFADLKGLEDIFTNILSTNLQDEIGDKRINGNKAKRITERNQKAAEGNIVDLSRDLTGILEQSNISKGEEQDLYKVLAGNYNQLTKESIDGLLGQIDSTNNELLNAALIQLNLEVEAKFKEQDAMQKIISDLLGSDEILELPMELTLDERSTLVGKQGDILDAFTEENQEAGAKAAKAYLEGYLTLIRSSEGEKNKDAINDIFLNIDPTDVFAVTEAQSKLTQLLGEDLTALVFDDYLDKIDLAVRDTKTLEEGLTKSRELLKTSVELQERNTTGSLTIGDRTTLTDTGLVTEEDFRMTINGYELVGQSIDMLMAKYSQLENQKRQYMITEQEETVANLEKEIDILDGATEEDHETFAKSDVGSSLILVLEQAKNELGFMVEEAKVFNDTMNFEIFDPFKVIQSSIDDYSKSLEKVTKLQEISNSKNVLGAKAALEYAQEYPGILKNAKKTADGQIKLDEAVVKSFMNGEEIKSDAAIESAIIELKARRAVLVGQYEAIKAELTNSRLTGNEKAKMATALAEHEVTVANAKTAILKELDEAGIANQDEYLQAYLDKLDNENTNLEISTNNRLDADVLATKTALANAKKVVAGYYSIARSANIAARQIVAMQDGTVISLPAQPRFDGSAIDESWSASGGYVGTPLEGLFGESVTIDDSLFALAIKELGGIGEAIGSINGQMLALQALKELDLSDLTKEGSGSGGSDAAKEYLLELDKWFNYLKRIATLEQEISNLQAKRKNISGGRAYAASLLEENIRLQEQEKLKRELLEAQQEYLKNLKGELNAEYGRYLYFVGDTLQIDYDAIMEATGGNQELGDGIQKAIDEYVELFDSVSELSDALEDLINQQAANLQELTEMQIEAEQQVLSALKDAEQEKIKILEKELAMREESNEKYLSSLESSLEKEQNMRSKQRSQDEQNDLEKRLALLKRDTSGKYAKEVADLEQQLKDKQEELSDTTRQDEIDRIREASSAEQDAIQDQIDQLEELRGLKEDNMELYWNEVYNLMTQTDEMILDFIKTNSQEYLELSAKQQEEYLKNLRKTIEAAKALMDGTAFDDAEKNAKDKNDPRDESNDPSIIVDPPATGGRPSGEGQVSSLSGLIKSGQKGASVTALQKALIALGYDLPRYGADGDFGSETLGSVKRFQRDNNVSADGIVGPNTKEKFKIYGYKEGGLVDKTGFAMLHGTKDKPETVLNSRETSIFQKFVEWLRSFGTKGIEDIKTDLSPQNAIGYDSTNIDYLNGQALDKQGQLFEQLANATKYLANAKNIGGTTLDIDIIFENANIANDYDVENITDKLKETLLEVAESTGNRVVTRSL
jgi:TP901 family phage tail tape measure protein